jgi:hypothetical protein
MKENCGLTSGGDVEKKATMLDVNSKWVSEGLCRMKGLRWIELEIDDEEVEREVKIRFCGELEEKLSNV